MIYKEVLLKELIKNGYALSNGIKVWDISKRTFRYISKEMAQAFLKLEEHPRYKANIIDTEIKLLKENASEFLKSLKNEPFNLIDVSCTEGIKAKEIINSLPKNMKIRYCPSCVNEFLVGLSLKNIKKENFSNIVDYAQSVTNDFESFDQVGAALRNTTYQKNAYLLLGSLLASFEINDYLFKLSQSMFPGDLLIIGNGIRKGERFTNLETYKHPLFNDWLIHLMRDLGFKDNEVKYNARFANNRLEAYYTVNIDKILEYENRKIKFKKGDEIIVAFQYKLYAKELEDFCDMYFDNVKLIQDSQEEYALVMCKK